MIFLGEIGYDGEDNVFKIEWQKCHAPKKAAAAAIHGGRLQAGCAHLLPFWDPQTQRVIVSVGAEKEYFIANRENYLKRKNVMKKVALQNRLVCLLHEKPFVGVNGSPDVYRVIKRSIRQRKGRFFHALTAF